MDNGYLDWATAIPPMKFPVTEEDEQFSRWAESMQKDVECAFGILKWWFTILSVPISIHSLDKVDRIW